MERRKIIRSLAFVLGLVLAFAGLGMLLLAASGAVVQGQAGAYVAGASFLAVAIPLLVAPFFARFAEAIATVVFAGFSAAMLWLAFGSNGTTPPIAFQVAAVLFGLLFLLRVGLALRKRPGVGT